MDKKTLLKARENTARIYLYGDIGDDEEWGEISAKSIAEKLDALPDTVEDIEIHINSYGGMVSEGLAIYNLLKNDTRNIKTIIDGFACSIAAVIFMAGTARLMYSSSLLMIHNPWQIVLGNQNELRKAADDLDTIAQASVNAFLENSNLDFEELKQLMDDETWISTEEAQKYGFVTENIGEAENESYEYSLKMRVKDALCKPSINKEEKQDLVTQKQFKEFAERISAAFEQKETQPQEEEESEPLVGYARLAKMLENYTQGE